MWGPYHELRSDTLRCHVIYVLRCPDTNAVRYVGTSRNAAYRNHSHCARKCNRRSPVNDWTSSLAEQGKQPIFEVVSEIRFAQPPEGERPACYPDIAARHLETHFIHGYLQCGCDLLNVVRPPAHNYYNSPK